MQCSFLFFICMGYHKNIGERSSRGHVVTNPYDSITTLSPRWDCRWYIKVTQSCKDTPTYGINMSHMEIPKWIPLKDKVIFQLICAFPGKLDHILRVKNICTCLMHVLNIHTQMVPFNLSLNIVSPFLPHTG